MNKTSNLIVHSMFLKNEYYRFSFSSILLFNDYELYTILYLSLYLTMATDNLKIKNVYVSK